MKEKKQEPEVDLGKLFHALWHRAWIIVLAAICTGVLAFGCTKFLVTPMYKARTLLYVNNNAATVTNPQLSISQGDLAAAKSLVDTYTVILKTRTTLESVIEQADLPYSYEQLVRMIKAAPVNGTGVFYIEVTGSKPAETELIANTIGKILPEKISAVLEGSSVRIADRATVPTRPSSPHVARNTVLGVLLGVLGSGAVIAVRSLLDKRIHDTDYLLQTYSIPVLAVIPDLRQADGDQGYYGRRTSRQGGKKHG